MDDHQYQRKKQSVIANYSQISGELPFTPSLKGYGVYNGQWKLHDVERRFLNKYEPATVLYVGAGPGHHLVQMADEYPEVTFHCYDTRWANLTFPRNVYKYNRFFTDAEATEKYDAFWSDIRIDSTPSSLETEVRKDMMQQLKWARMLQSSNTMLKFRIPFDNQERFPYCGGDLWIQAWAPLVSAELRLVVIESELNKTVFYDPSIIERRMFYYNIRDRPFNDLALHDYISEGGY